ncbi:PREDICTED: uncharacterized protein LOC109223491 isoform X1 [Nicotiana attenuata]|uniref:uncharacterized protein LOC109223491 isoform X1 n=1 Tax=Nicotiana attenuata TaxID=49451 RepID=UPI0009050AEB|nr:PREDICTED: uncharacterized protein LOC109223491 isoform X1 [Nicotiana attenuata]XP_019243367.1 PREDICTED: uncharacterized protein LOC109223491 isoform X1 [Nicotiana attenuata]XP_019243368.1 PREDICTED: uncharacterized protein LOC109223491 isoform X1 [Nicotiana attenuata]XP_019243369.1 PREDICTED: uncharacterized protein LOC109223491 isoform X1 [Nicotiana attenuata]
MVEKISSTQIKGTIPDMRKVMQQIDFQENNCHMICSLSQDESCHSESHSIVIDINYAVNRRNVLFIQVELQLSPVGQLCITIYHRSGSHAFTTELRSVEQLHITIELRPSEQSFICHRATACQAVNATRIMCR